MRHHSPRSGLFRRWLTTTTALAGVLPVLALTSPAAHANPEGGSVVQGAATITQTNPKTVTVNQTTDKAVINWQSFSIGADETTRFNQPSSSSTTLNRVTGDQVSKILGNLSANGKVFLVNPNGIVFGAGSKIDVAALVASTADIKTENFMAGNMRFDIPGKVGAEIINQGTITAADGGLVTLVSPVLRNSGIIQARLGKVALASANGVTLDLYGDNLILFQATDKITQQMVDTDGKPVNTAIDNSGQIYADGGRVLMTANTAKGVVDNAINTTGLVSARAVEQQGGEIVLKGEDGGNVQVGGTLDASGKNAGQTGGAAHVLGEKVGLVGDAVVDVSGDAGGGNALIGGDYLGKGSVRNSDVTYAGTNTVVNANAITTGKGGKVVLWADDTTRVYGSIYAKGGSQSGDGGFIETSGKNKLTQSGTVDASASYGAAGTWLMDPGTIYVRNNVTNSNIDTDGSNCIHGCFGNYAYFQPASDADTYISAQSIANALRLGNSVWLSNVQRSEADINIEGDIEFTPTTVTGSNDVGLFLWAGRDINVTDGSIKQIGNNGLGADLFVMLNAGYGGGVGDVHVGKIDKTTSTIDVGASVSIYGQNVVLYRTLASSNEYTVKSGNDVEIARRNANDPSGFPRNATLVSLPDRAIYAYSSDPNDRTDHGDISMFTNALLLQSGANGVPELSLNGTYYVSTSNYTDVEVKIIRDDTGSAQDENTQQDPNRIVNQYENSDDSTPIAEEVIIEGSPPVSSNDANLKNKSINDALKFGSEANGQITNGQIKLANVIAIIDNDGGSVADVVDEFMTLNSGYLTGLRWFSAGFSASISSTIAGLISKIPGGDDLGDLYIKENIDPILQSIKEVIEITSRERKLFESQAEYEEKIAKAFGKAATSAKLLNAALKLKYNSDGIPLLDSASKLLSAVSLAEKFANQVSSANTYSLAAKDAEKIKLTSIVKNIMSDDGAEIREKLGIPNATLTNDFYGFVDGRVAVVSK